MGGPGGVEEGVGSVPTAAAMVAAVAQTVAPPALTPTASAAVPAEVDNMKMDQYEVKEQVGKGSFGQAFLVIHRETKLKCVVLPSVGLTRGPVKRLLSEDARAVCIGRPDLSLPNGVCRISSKHWVGTRHPSVPTSAHCT
jgi:hypothetical protein